VSLLVTSVFDQADRVADPGYTYDALGRTLTVPSGDAAGIGSHASATGDLSVGYWADDMVATQTEGGQSMSFTLDPMGSRIAAFTGVDGTVTTNYYVDGGGSPAWAQTGGAWTRNLIGIDGGLAGTEDQDGTVTLQLANPHGDIVATVADDPTTVGPDSHSESTEYGQPRDPASAADTYGWHGAVRLSTNSLAGLALTGVRLYSPSTGRFLTADPIVGGNPNAYTYPVNPIDSYDVSGQCGFWGVPWHKCKTPTKTGLRADSCGNFACISYQLTPYGQVAWGFATKNHGNGVFVTLRVYVNGKEIDKKDGYRKGIPHGGLFMRGVSWVWSLGGMDTRVVGAVWLAARRPKSPEW